MLAKIIKFVKENKSDIILFIVVFLGSLISFVIGYLCE